MALYFHPELSRGGLCRATGSSRHRRKTLKVSVATSKFLLSITDTSAAWICMNRGCVIPLIGVPSIVGLMLGSLIGVKILAVAKPKMIRYMVIIVLFFGGIVHQLFPAVTASPGAYSIVGMGAVAAATTHGPLSVILILFEMTGDYKIILPVVAADDHSQLLGVLTRKDILDAYDRAVIKRSITDE